MDVASISLNALIQYPTVHHAQISAQPVSTRRFPVRDCDRFHLYPRDNHLQSRYRGQQSRTGATSTSKTPTFRIRQAGLNHHSAVAETVETLKSARRVLLLTIDHRRCFETDRAQCCCPDIMDQNLGSTLQVDDAASTQPTSSATDLFE